MSRFLRLRILVPLLFLLSGCASYNCSPLEEVLGVNGNLILLSNQIADQLILQAMPPLVPRHPNQAILATTFVNNDKLEETSRFGRILQQHIGTRFVQQGYTVKEIKLRKNMLMRKDEGELILSRDLQLITNSQPAQAILVGTYSYTNDIMYLSSRLVDPQTRNIIAAYDCQLCMDNNVLAMFGLKRKQPDEKRDQNSDEIQPPRESTINAIFY